MVCPTWRTEKDMHCIKSQNHISVLFCYSYSHSWCSDVREYIILSVYFWMDIVLNALVKSISRESRIVFHLSSGEYKWIDGMILFKLICIIYFTESQNTKCSSIVSCRLFISNFLQFIHISFFSNSIFRSTISQDYLIHSLYLYRSALLNAFSIKLLYIYFVFFFCYRLITKVICSLIP